MVKICGAQSGQEKSQGSARSRNGCPSAQPLRPPRPLPVPPGRHLRGRSLRRLQGGLHRRPGPAARVHRSLQPAGRDGPLPGPFPPFIFTTFCPDIARNSFTADAKATKIISSPSRSAANTARNQVENSINFNSINFNSFNFNSFNFNSQFFFIS